MTGQTGNEASDVFAVLSQVSTANITSEASQCHWNDRLMRIGGAAQDSDLERAKTRFWADPKRARSANMSFNWKYR